MSVSFLDGATIKGIRENILKLNLGVTFDASHIGYSQSVFTDRNKYTTVNELDLNVKDEPRVVELQEPYSISLLRKNKYQSTSEGYREVTIEENPRVSLRNENNTEYDDLVNPFIGGTISDQGNNLIDIKTLILNNNIDSYNDTPIGLIGIRVLDKLIKENISANIESSTVGRFNTNPTSLLKGNSFIIPDRTISKVSPTLADIANPTYFLKAGVDTTNEYLGYTTPVSLIPESAIGWQEFNIGRGEKKRQVIERGDSKFSNFLEGVDKFKNNLGDKTDKILSKLGIGNQYDLSTEARMEEFLKYTGEGQKELIFKNLSVNTFQPGYSYQQSLLKTKKLADFQANTIQKNLINRGSIGNKSVYGLLGNKLRYEKFNLKGAYELNNNDEKSVLKSNGMVRIAPDKDNQNIKNFMFSIENLAWADVSDAFMSEAEKGIGDPSSGLRGKMMWFPPYDLKVDDSTTANWDSEDFLGRPEPVFTYNNSSRSGSLSFKIIVDHPSIINLAKGQQKDILEKYFSGEIGLDDLDPKQTSKITEDQERGYLRNVVGDVNKPKLNLGKLTKSETFNLTSIFSDRPNKEFTDKKNPPTFFSDVENNWFSENKVDQDITYKYLAEKIQFFHPAFHSSSPESFNSRLTFLQQCLRQGPSITEGGKGSGNLAFGRPPVCILRVGDFYNTKIKFNSLSISYDDGGWDLNPDGIGVQPMIATISMSFDFIGGSSLTGPINRLQNAVSFNFFANTEVYEIRSDFWREATKDEKKVAKDNGNDDLKVVLNNGMSGTIIKSNEKNSIVMGEPILKPINENQIKINNLEQVQNSSGQLVQNTKKTTSHASF